MVCCPGDLAAQRGSLTIASSQCTCGSHAERTPLGVRDELPALSVRAESEETTSRPRDPDRGTVADRVADGMMLRLGSWKKCRELTMRW